MNNIKIGGLVKGISDKESNVNKRMTKGLVTDISNGIINVRIIEHDNGIDGIFSGMIEDFQNIELKKFNRDEVLNLLKNGWNKSVLGYDLRGADLRSANLRSANLKYADLVNANLKYADLVSANLKYANLVSANLKYADLEGTDLRSANLRSANLRSADLRSANLRSANLKYADLVNANLRSADLRSADLVNANLEGADLRSANLVSANLEGADLDFSCYPLWCGGLNIKIDKRIACQLAYHLCAAQCDDEEYIQMRNSILDFANQFHRVDECGELKEI